MHDTVIIGAGLAGILAALELAKTQKVLLIEAGNEALPVTCSSINECYKLHTGMHYIGDKATAEQCLLKAIEFAKAFPEFIAGGADLLSPWRRGRHYIMANSLTSAEEAKQMARHLQALYTQKVQEDPANEVFGKPDDFISLLDMAETPVATSIPYCNSDGNWENTEVALGIETAESQVDMERLKPHLQALIANHPNITFLPNTQVTTIDHDPKQLGYQLTVQQGQSTQQLSAKAVVNCAWQNIERLDKSIGFDVIKPPLINRVKVSVVVDLPDELARLNTCIFSSGAYGSITVLPNKTAILTSERLTNVGFYPANEEPSEALKHTLRTLTLNNTQGQQLAQQIRDECAAYLRQPERDLLRQAVINEIRVGYVKMVDKDAVYSLKAFYEAESPIHARVEEGVEVRNLGYIANAGMKMTYTVSNAKTVAKARAKLDCEEKRFLKMAQQIQRHVTASPYFNDALNEPLQRLLYTTYKASLYQLIKEENGPSARQKLMLMRLGQTILNDILKGGLTQPSSNPLRFN